MRDCPAIFERPQAFGFAAIIFAVVALQRIDVRKFSVTRMFCVRGFVQEFLSRYLRFRQDRIRPQRMYMRHRRAPIGNCTFRIDVGRLQECIPGFDVVHVVQQRQAAFE